MRKVYEWVLSILIVFVFFALCYLIITNPETFLIIVSLGVVFVIVFLIKILIVEQILNK